MTNGHSEIAVTNGHAEHESAAEEPAEHAYGFAPALLADPVDAPAGSEVDGEPGVAIDPVCGMKVAASESTQHLDVAGVTGLLLRDRLPGRIRLAASRRRKPLALT